MDKREKLIKLLEKAVIDGLDEIIKYDSEDKTYSLITLFDKHKSPSIHYFDNGLPHFNMLGENATDYSKILLKKGKDIQSWNDFHIYINSDSELWELVNFIGDGYFESLISDSEFAKTITQIFLSHFLDAYVHTYSKSFDYENYLEQANLVCNAIFQKSLSLVIFIPILFVKFDFAHFSINEQITIENISESHQLARNHKIGYTDGANKNVVGASTHAIFLRNWSIENIGKNKLGWTLSDFASFSAAKEIVDLLFASFRIVLGIETGYCQFVSLPSGWLTNLPKVKIPSVYIASEKNYPKQFENYGWLKEPYAISTNDMERIKEVYQHLKSSKHLSLAIKRLNNAHLRSNEEDSILDITVALESLLTNDSINEIGYRLATRAALICKKYPFTSYKPNEVSDLCKSLYKFRSAVVHGSTKIDKLRVIKNVEKSEIPIVKLGIDLLRHIILAIAADKELNSVDKIDQLIYN